MQIEFIDPDSRFLLLKNSMVARAEKKNKFSVCKSLNGNFPKQILSCWQGEGASLVVWLLDRNCSAITQDTVE